MKPIHNPFPPENNPCFGCSKNNPAGLQLDFYEDGDQLVASWDPEERFQGYHNVLHGGIQATLLDEIAAWTVYVQAGTAGVTAEMKVSYHKPVHLSHGSIKLEAKILEQEGKLAHINGKLFDGKGDLCTSADMKYFVYPADIAIRRFNYPGKEAFYK